MTWSDASWFSFEFASSIFREQRQMIHFYFVDQQVTSLNWLKHTDIPSSTSLCSSTSPCCLSMLMIVSTSGDIDLNWSHWFVCDVRQQPAGGSGGPPGYSLLSRTIISDTEEEEVSSNLDYCSSSSNIDFSVETPASRWRSSRAASDHTDVWNVSPDRSSMFSEENREERLPALDQVQVLRVGSSVGRKFLQTQLGTAEEPGASVRLEGTSWPRWTGSVLKLKLLTLKH